MRNIAIGGDGVKGVGNAKEIWVDDPAEGERSPGRGRGGSCRQSIPRAAPKRERDQSPRERKRERLKVASGRLTLSFNSVYVYSAINGDAARGFDGQPE